MISSITLSRTNVTCQTVMAHAAARVGWFAYRPSCPTVDADVSHCKLATVLTVRINASFAPSAPPNRSESGRLGPNEILLACHHSCGHLLAWCYIMHSGVQRNCRPGDSCDSHRSLVSNSSPPASAIPGWKEQGEKPLSLAV